MVTQRRTARTAVAQHSMLHMVVTFAVSGALLAVTLYFCIPVLYPVRYAVFTSPPVGSRATSTVPIVAAVATSVSATASTSVPSYVATPSKVRAIYMSQCVVGTRTFRDRLVALIDDTELNAVVIDLKDYTGKISFSTDNPALAASVSDACGARDMRAFVAQLHERGIYVIGRITVFQDPYYSLEHPEFAVKFAHPAGTVWKDRKGLSFIDVGAKPYWDYIITLSREARLMGFDELNYDYVRFPSDGPMTNIAFDWIGTRTKQEVLEDFFSYLHSHVTDATTYPQGITPPAMSADLFGMVTTNTDDLGIGQVLERALPYFDFICPMVYPSHYPSGFNGWANPNTVPGEVITYVLTSAVRRTVATSSVVAVGSSTEIMKTTVVPPHGSSTATTTKQVPTGRFTKEPFDKEKIRPWLQDFDYGGDYDAAAVRAQIRSTYGVGLTSWMLWAPSNEYTRDALEKQP